MNTNSPYPQFAPNPNAPLDLSGGNAYLSDCTNVYMSSQSEGEGGGGDYYTTGQEACYYCEDTIMSALNPWGTGYQYAGACSSAPTSGEAGAGYASDCANYYVANPANQGDQASPAAACQSCTNVKNSILSTGYTQSGTCSALKPIPVTSENFEMFFNHSKNNVAIIIALLLLCVVLFFMFKHFKGRY